MDDTLLLSQSGLAPRALVVSGERAILMGMDGELEQLTLPQARTLAETAPLLVCHAKLLASRLGQDLAQSLDVLELFAFVRPARFTVPTPKGLAATLGLPEPADPESEAFTLWQAQDALLADLSDLKAEARERAAAIAGQMGRGGWPWARLGGAGFGLSCP
jgi:ATP-dependent DNA helicase DinG